MTENLENTLFWAVHQGLPREAPGDDASTLQALAMIPSLPHTPQILDIGCGPGAQTVALAQATQGQITAVDTHQPFLDVLARRAEQAGVSDRITPLNMSMFELTFDNPFDLIWSEGAIYIIGFEKGLKAWRLLLKPSGYLVVTEATWLKPDPPEAAASFWDEAYPEMGDVAENVARINRSGYRLIDHFTLPKSAWWDHYYHPMAARIADLRQQYAENDKAQRILDLEAAEIDLYRKYSDYYGYVFYILQIDG